jgi:hypothetical protein
MARRSSQALAGFFPCPPHLIPGLATMLRPDTFKAPSPPADPSKANWITTIRDDRITRIVDPCAGEGHALKALAHGIGRDKPGLVETYGCEMEEGRARTLGAFEHRYSGSRYIHGDFFHVRFAPRMADILLLNPPYDQDRKFKRLEARFLHHAAPLLTHTGVLVFVVPHYAMSACASIFAMHFEDARAYRFPGDDFEAFKQIVVLARKTARSAPDPAVAAWCEAVSLDVSGLPELQVIPAYPDKSAGGFEARPELRAEAESKLQADPLFRYPAPTRDRGGYQGETWEVVGFDVSSCANLHPWESDKGAIPDLAHPTDLLSKHGAVYPVAQPPRPIHLASALAAGVFNGLKVGPNDEGSGLPMLLVKGTFRRKWASVDTKRDEDGAVTSETQVERPELEVWVLDLTTGAYHEIASSAVQAAGALQSIEGATFADLLTHYSKGLLAALRAACPVLHDPGRGDIEPMVETAGRPLWRAQNTVLHATSKIVDLAGGAIIVGEVGTGKTGISATLTKLRGSRRALVQAPPHLLSSWQNQIAAVLPGVDVVTLERVSDVERLRAHPGPVIALLSREASKLGHGWRDVGTLAGGVPNIPGDNGSLPFETTSDPAAFSKKKRRLPHACPRCGASIETDRLADRRATCTAPRLAPSPAPGTTALGRWVRTHLLTLTRCLPTHSGLVSLLPRTRAMESWHGWASKALVSDEIEARMVAALGELFALLANHLDLRDTLLYRVAWAWPELARPGLSTLPCWSPEMGDHYSGPGRALLKTRQAIALALDPSEPFALELHPDELSRYEPKSRTRAWREWTNMRASIHRTYEEGKDPGIPYSWTSGSKGDGMGYGSGHLLGATRGSRKAMEDTLHAIISAARFAPRHSRPNKRAAPRPTAVCGEPLYQAEPRPRRYPLGAYISSRVTDLFDTLIFDESHELSSDTSAQGIMFMRLAQMAHKSGATVLCLTGSIANGYAESLFNALWAVSPEFRGAFKWGDREAFIDKYGLRKRVVLHNRKDGAAITVSRGATSERIIGKIKPAGCTPGVLPTLVIHHLLRSATIIHKADLDLDLPALSESCPILKLPPEVEANLNTLLAAVKKAIGATRFSKDLAGRLFGALTGLLSYPDLAAVGTEPDGSYVLRWPQSCPEIRVKGWPDLIGPGLEIVQVPALPAGLELPKEAWMLDRVRAEIAEGGRGSLVLPTHRVLLTRYVELFKAAGVDALLLDAEKVEAKKREAWIDRHLVAKRRRVLIANPTCIQTGLNNLVTLQTALWMENPNCNPIVDEQGNGRLHRPGQEREVRILRPVYDHPLTLAGFRLQMHKIGVVRAVNGLSPEAVYAAAGIGDEMTAGLSVGQELYRMLVNEAEES